MLMKYEKNRTLVVWILSQIQHLALPSAVLVSLPSIFFPYCIFVIIIYNNAVYTVVVFIRSLAEKLPISVSSDSYDSPHTKTHLLLQAHFSSAPLPIADYVTDTKSVLDQALRILQVIHRYFLHTVNAIPYTHFVPQCTSTVCV